MKGKRDKKRHKVLHHVHVLFFNCEFLREHELGLKIDEKKWNKKKGEFHNIYHTKEEVFESFLWKWNVAKKKIASRNLNTNQVNNLELNT